RSDQAAIGRISALIQVRKSRNPGGCCTKAFYGLGLLAGDRTSGPRQVKNYETRTQFIGGVAAKKS
ncbi:MAG: hypothetical protein AAFP69_01645, partial [Planctomycetota bacterium]